MNKTFKFRANAGFSLVELMVALVLTSFLVLGLVQVFSASRTAYQSSMGVSRTQEGGRFAMDFLQRDFRLVGHSGCTNDRAHFVNAQVVGDAEFYNHLAGTSGGVVPDTNAATAHLRFDVPMQGFEATVPGATTPGSTIVLSAMTTPASAVPGAGSWSPTIPTGIYAGMTTNGVRPRTGSDVVILRVYSGESAPVLTAPTAGPITTSAALAGTPGNTFAVANCVASSVFRSSNTTGTSFTLAGNATGFTTNGQEFYANTGSNLYHADVYVYFVGFRNATPTTPPSLYRAHWNGAWTNEELVEGVDMIQMTYGQDVALVNGSVDTYAAASVVSSATPVDAAVWRAVGTVRLGLLLRSPDRAGSYTDSTAGATRNIPIAGGAASGGYLVTVSANDGFLRVPYDNVIAFRNRLIGN
ncbi:PilW family protein [Arenimonas oryziterrae]|uniref:Prepilin-type N-terminal cleavage/methylation domain-containing protein n=1 Tax=Arenimonas oryziterrae DSM 21050 = YC6267 TaxID=1121015 RepID=A0A091B270_9GAMM|nr:PilW family protein [Arenimonas oryziterrae]KFN44964.1 hypothetical protein N789_02800 [Arenimonas oryziterrae DSM 21050 = YC6267]